MKYIVLIGRICFSAIFLMTFMHHFSGSGIAYAASKGVPFPSVLVPVSGVLALAGALSVLFGYKAKAGAWLLVLFLVPVTFLMHNFWTVTDPQMAQMQMGMFMKNISMLGCAFLITYFGSGPLSLDAARSKPADEEKEEKEKLAA
jgi:putative oxidoreductase